MKFKLFGRLRDEEEQEQQQERSQQRGGRNLPVEEIRRMANQGFSQEEITQSLREEGYSYSAIDEAMKRAVKENTRRKQRKGEMPSQPPQPGPDDLKPGGPAQGQAVPQQGGSGVSSQQPPAGTRPSGSQGQRKDIYSQEQSEGEVQESEEELIETVVSEDTEDLEQGLKRLRDGINQLEGDLSDLEEKVDELEEQREKDREKIKEKMDQIEDYYTDTQAKISALEKALKSILPDLVENLRDFSRLVEEVKEE